MRFGDVFGTGHDAAISIATHKANVFVDLSGWLPKYFPPQLVRQLGTLLRTKALFGSDFQLDVREEERPLTLKENAARLLGLRASSPHQD